MKEEKVDPKKAAKPGQKAPSPAFDESKPYWTLRVCADAGIAEIESHYDYISTLLGKTMRPVIVVS